MTKLWLSRDESGYYSLWGLKPIVRRILNSARQAWYPTSFHDMGEPVMWRGMCSEVTDVLLGGPSGLDPLGEPLRVYAVLIRADRMTPELERLLMAAQTLTPNQ